MEIEFNDYISKLLEDEARAEQMSPEQLASQIIVLYFLQNFPDIREVSKLGQE